MSYFSKKIPFIHFSLILVSITLAVMGFIKWFSLKPTQAFTPRKAKVNKATQKLNKGIDIEGRFYTYKGKASTQHWGNWPHFRGPQFNNISNEAIPLRKDFSTKGLPILWDIQVGEGYGGAAIAHGRVYLLDYDKKTQEEMLRCLSFDDGQEIWRHSYKIPIKRNHGITRTVPAVSEKYVLSLGPKCQALCLDALTGEYKWGLDLRNAYNTKVPLWYTGQCPLILNQIGIIAPAGKSLIIGLDLESGKTIFETPNNFQFQMSHSSITPMKIFEKNLIVYTPIGGLVACSMEKDDLGEIVFSTKEWKHSVVSPSPVFIPPNQILVTAGYGGGSMLFEVSREGKNWNISKLKSFTKKQFACEQHTPIFYKDYLYTIMPSDAGKLNRQLVCMNLRGNVKWSSGLSNKFGLGPFIIGDSKFFILDDHGVLTIASTDPEKYIQYSQTQVLNGIESWAPMALSEGRILLRDFTRLICLDLIEK